MKHELLVGTLIFALFGTLYHFDNTVQTTIKEDIDPLFKHFEAWKKDFQQEFDSIEENLYRFNVYKANHEFVKKTNEKEGDEIVELNHLAHISHQEYKQLFLNTHKDSTYETIKNMIPEYKLKATTNEDPDYVNWIEKGIVIPSMDVGNCAASYAFATASATSSLYASESGNLTPLSTQQFISCDNTQGGCRGGFGLYSLLYSIKNGVETEASYPYTSKHGGVKQCEYDASEVEFTPNNGYVLKASAPEVLQSVVAKHPVTASINADDQAFQFYKGGKVYQGTFDCDNQSNQPNYTVAIVGYNNDTDSNKPYYIIQSSFGPKWGDDGFMKIKKTPKGVGTCQLYKEVQFPAYE